MATYFRALLLLFFSTAAMKMHEYDNRTAAVRAAQQRIRSMSCADMGRELVNTMVSNLQKSQGNDAVFFRGCLQFLEKNAQKKRPAAAQIEALGEACKGGEMGEGSILDDVDPSHLAAECDRATYGLDVQLRLLGEGAFKTSEDFCAVFVDLVLPIDEEPECMRFIEDITNAHYEFSGSPHLWPAITKQKHFDEAFMRACLEDKKLEEEAEGMDVPWGTGEEKCQQLLERMVAKQWPNYNKISDFFAEACPLMEKALPKPTDKKVDTLTATKRSLATSLFHRASHVVLAKHGGNHSAAAHLFEPKKQRKFSAVSLLDDSVSGKEGRRRRRSRRRLTEDAKACCSKKAYNWAVEAFAGEVVTMSASVSLSTYGFLKEEGSTCLLKKGHVSESCVGWEVGVDINGPMPDLALPVTIGHGWFNSYGDILGESTYLGAGGCFILCVGGNVIQNMQGKVIGGTIEFGFGAPGVSIEGGICNCKELQPEQKPIEFPHLLGEGCPSGCFPGDAQVQTLQGTKRMKDLQVGDRVLATDSLGKLFFDEVYFFGHADPSIMSPMIELRVQAASNASFALELSPDHFIHTCPGLKPCSFLEAQAAYSAAILEGAYVWTVQGIAKVLSSRMVPKQGLFNPYTLSGNIIVNGVAASAHSSWVLDAWVPSSLVKHLPKLYQAIFSSGRWIYWLAGAPAADFMGVNNPLDRTPWLAYGVAGSFVTFVCSIPLLATYGWTKCARAKVAVFT